LSTGAATIEDDVMRQRQSKAARARTITPLVLTALALGLWGLEAQAFAQAAPKPADMELDPDAPPPPPKEPEALPELEPGAWGVGGTEEAGRFAPPTRADASKPAEVEEDKGPIDRGPKAVIGVDTVIGFGRVQVISGDSPGSSVNYDTTALSFVIGARYRFGDVWTLGFRFPMSTASSKVYPAAAGASDYNSFAIGNATIDVAPTFAPTRHLRLPLGVSVSLPTAQGDLFAGPSEVGDRGLAIANQAAAASRGWEDNALFAPRRFGFTPKVGLSYTLGAARLSAGMKLDLMVKVSGEDPVDPKIADPKSAAAVPVVRSTTMSWVTDLSFFYEFFDGMLAPGMRAWLAVASVPVSLPSVDPSGAQFVLEPDVTGRFKLGKSLKLGAGVGYIAPLGGPLAGGSAAMGGVRLRAELLF
jgi:hypothetical protein